MVDDQFARHQQVLAEVMAALAASMTVEQAGAALAGVLRTHLRASVIGVCRLRDGRLSLVHQSGYPADAAARFAVTALDDPLPYAEAARTGRPVWLHNRDEWRRRYPERIADLRFQTQAAAALPMRIGRRVVGTVAVSFDTPRTFPPEERRFLETVTTQAALAFDRAATTEDAAATAAQLRRLVAGVDAVVWDRDAATGRVGFVNDRVESLLGYPVQAWLDEPNFWHSRLHPDDAERVTQAVADAVAVARIGPNTGSDVELIYRLCAANGRTVWVRDLTRIEPDPDGGWRLHGVLVDVTASRRREQTAQLLADVARLLSGPDPVAQRLTAVAERTLAVLGAPGGAVIVRLIGDDGRLRPVAVAPTEQAAAVLAIGAIEIPPTLRAFVERDAPFVIETDSLLVAEATRRAKRQDLVQETFGGRRTLVVPLTVGGSLDGILSLVGRPGSDETMWDDAGLAVAGEVGARVAAVVAAERARERQMRLHRTSAALAAADSLDEVARVLVEAVAEAFGASAQSVAVVDHERRVCRVVRAEGYPPEQVRRFGKTSLDAPLPIAEVVRTGTSVWLHDRGEWLDRYPHLAGELNPQSHAALTLPLRVGRRIVGAVAASFPTSRTFSADERAFAETLAAQAAQAFERAVEADRRRDVADTLQHALLPAALPRLPRLGLTARYLPASHNVAAGGDWYDVVAIDDHRVAVAVGDVVGHGAVAAAVMGQLRAVLTAFLAEGRSPVTALDGLDRYAAHVPGARGSTAVCLVFDDRTGALSWATAGHPPPLSIAHDRPPELLEAATGTVLGVADAPPRTEGRAILAPGDSVLLYTDGLIERRHEPIDDGLARLVATGDPGLAPDTLAEHLLNRVGPPGQSTDDIALVLLRYLPAPLVEHLPAAAPVHLRQIRRTVNDWAHAAGLSTEHLEDLQFALCEALTNAIEHGYRDRAPGPVTYQLELIGQDSSLRAVRVEVRDEGNWRPPPTDLGVRGHGLPALRSISQNLLLDITDGTTLSFTIPRQAVD